MDNNVQSNIENNVPLEQKVTQELDEKNLEQISGGQFTSDYRRQEPIQNSNMPLTTTSW